MNSVAGSLILLLVSPSIAFFQYDRHTRATSSSGQAYIVIDDAVWKHAETELGDLRLYRSGAEVPYALEIERGGSQADRKELRVFQPAVVRRKTEFLLDMSMVEEYDRVDLRLDTKNFVAHAQIEGADDSHSSRWALLGSTTLYDLSKEQLGHNSTLQIPVSQYRFLRVGVESAIKPSDISGASAEITRFQKVVWRTIDSTPHITQRNKDTVVSFSVPNGLPVERFLVDIEPDESNFRREVEIQDINGEPVGSGEIDRVHMRRNGQSIDTDRAALIFRAVNPGTLKILIHNGDDPPLKITGAQLQQYERRIYFNADSAAAYTVYYGDKLLSPPIYDYAKFFQPQRDANEILVDGEERNSAFTGRADERPWSERHPALLWATICAAVLVLAVVALKSIRAAAAGT